MHLESGGSVEDLPPACGYDAERERASSSSSDAQAHFGHGGHVFSPHRGFPIVCASAPLQIWDIEKNSIEQYATLSLKKLFVK